MASFAPFPRLPYELRREIWTLAIPEPESEVCMVWPLVLERDYDRGAWEEPAMPLTVDTAWPAIMHACREGREAVLTSRRLTLRRSAAAGGLAVPYRLFDPAIDTLYWGDAQTDAVRDFLVENREHGLPLARALHQIAVDVRAAYPMSFLAEIVRRAAPNLQTLSLVLPDTASRTHGIRLALLPPARRCRLRDLPPELCREIAMIDLPSFGGEVTPDTMSVAAFLEHVRDRMRHHVRAFRVSGPDGTAWSSKDRAFSGLAIKAQTFVEYEYDDKAGRGRWTEVCGGRMLDHALGRYHRPPHIAVPDRRNPEEHRVIEDDCRFRELPPPAPYPEHDFW